MLLQALCIIWWPLVNSNWSYSPETPNLGKIWRFFSRVTLKFDEWPWKTIGHLFWPSSSFVYHFIAKCEFGPETAKWGHGLCDLDLWPMTLTFCMDITSAIDNNSWKFRDDTMMGT